MGNHLPAYCEYRQMAEERSVLAAQFARQTLQTCKPFLPADPAELSVLDIGCGYGHTAVEMAKVCRHVVGIEPSPGIYEAARALQEEVALPNLELRHEGIEEFDDRGCYDLVILDSVLEHMPNQPLTLAKIAACLKPGGLAYLIVPNKLWPIEAHYYLPFLSYLPLRLANAYLRLTGRGTDYTDASYAPTYFGMRRLLRPHPDLACHFVVPADVSLATVGKSFHYRWGVAALRRFPLLWTISKAFLVVLVKQGPSRGARAAVATSAAVASV